MTDPKEWPDFRLEDDLHAWKLPPVPAALERRVLRSYRRSAANREPVMAAIGARRSRVCCVALAALLVVSLAVNAWLLVAPARPRGVDADGERSRGARRETAFVVTAGSGFRIKEKPSVYSGRVLEDGR